jgi:transcriptional regulator with XRE-family HTH domain
MTHHNRPDPEVQAGRALRRLRLAKGWSQEEVARRMRIFGYAFHQTMIAKIEAAQRPLRVRELADFAALYGVDVQDLFYPPSGSVSEIENEIAEVKEMLKKAMERMAFAYDMQAALRSKMEEADMDAALSSRDAALLDTRLTSLLKERDQLLQWETSESHSD